MPIMHGWGWTAPERAFESYLRGTDGERTLETDLQGNLLRVLKQTDAHSGQNIYLTIDLDLQTAAEDALAPAHCTAQRRRNRCGGRRCRCA